MQERHKLATRGLKALVITWILSLFLVTGCRTAPRAIAIPEPVSAMPAIKQVQTSIKKADTHAAKAEELSKKAVEQGIVAKSPESKALLNAVQETRKELATAKEDIVKVEERASTQEAQRKYHQGESQRKDEEITKVKTALTVSEDRKKWWRRFAIGFGSLISILIVWKFYTLYQKGTNPLSWLKR